MVGVVFVFVVVVFLERGEGIGVRWLFQEGGIYKIIFRGGGGMYSHKYSLKHKNDINGHP